MEDATSKLTGMITDLEKRVKEAELSYLIAKIDELDEEVTKLEFDLNCGTTEEIANMFVNKILTKYWRLLNSQCKHMNQRINATYMDEDDYKQESFEYLLRHCLPRVVQFSTRDNLWLPFIKKSLHNCYVNLLKKHLTQSRKADLVELTDEIISNEPDLQMDVHSEYEFKELVSRVLIKLSNRDQTIFMDVVDPPITLRTFITLKQKELKSKKYSARQLMAEYYKLPITTINSVFSRFRKILFEVCENM
jgi:DNA-directed RNA polymerase specialized sigma24 family protein